MEPLSALISVYVGRRNGEGNLYEKPRFFQVMFFSDRMEITLDLTLAKIKKIKCFRELSGRNHLEMVTGDEEDF